MTRQRTGLFALGIVLAATTACTPTTDRSAAPGAGASASSSASPSEGMTTCVVERPLGPDTGAWWGVSVDPARDSLAAYARRLGHHPAISVDFVQIPLRRDDVRSVDAAVEAAAEQGATLLLSLEPTRGLGAVDDASVDRLVTALGRWNAAGVPVVVRYAHDMNGSWYRWGQQPVRFKASFRRVAEAVHEGAPGSATMWAPAYGGGYPFTGTVSTGDDPYAPYYPGDDVVDWVGMSLYHWGNVYPWGENEVPSRGKLVSQLRGTYRGFGVDERATPDFYAEYGARRGKPVAVAETAALYAPGNGGAAEVRVKNAWLRQVLSPSLLHRLPRLKMLNWFEWDKREQEVDGPVSWTATRPAPVRTLLREALPVWARFGDPGRAGC